MTIDWQHARVFRAALSPSASEIDGLGHTNNAVYVRWCEQVAWQHSESLGITLAEWQRLDRAMAIVDARYAYRAATFEGEALELQTCLSGAQAREPLQRHFRLLRLSDNAEVFTGLWQFRCIEISSGRPKRLPPRFKSVYGGAAAHAVQLLSPENLSG